MNQLWVYIDFPVVGGILGGAAWRALRPMSDELTEELAEAGAPAPHVAGPNRSSPVRPL